MNRKTGIILSYVFMIFEVLSTLLLTPFIIRTLGQAEYGVYKLAAGINAYLLLLDLGVGNAIVRYMSKYRAENDITSQKKFLGVATIYYSCIAVLTIAIGIVIIHIFPVAFAKGLSENEARLGQKLLWITMLNSAITLGTSAYNNVLIAYERYSVSKGYSILQIILRMILTYWALKAGMGSVGIVSVNLLMTVLCRGFFVCYVFKVLKLKPQFHGINLRFVKEIVTYSTWILIQMTATQINVTADQMLLGSLVASSASLIAIYGVGSQIVTYFQSIGNAFTGVLMPGVVRLVEGGSTSQQLNDEMVRIGRIIFMVLGMIWGCFLLYGKQFIILWAGTENVEAYYVTSILITAYLIILTQSIGTQVLWAQNAHKEQAILKLTIVIVNVVLTILLIQWKPLIGATIGTFLSLMLGDVLTMNIIFKRKIGISLKVYYTNLLKGLLPCLIILISSGLLVIKIPVMGWGGFVLKVAISCAIYAGSLWLIGMNRYEHRLALSLIKR
jgi:O-antigen/teichoic acid export membrane protein